MAVNSLPELVQELPIQQKHMLILAVDTSGKQGSIALAECAPEKECAVLETAPLDGGTFSAQLVPQMAALLASRGLGKHDVGGFAVVSGPGSFTGLRVGLAVVKALAEVLGKPIAAVSLLEAISIAGRPGGTVLAALDAGRNEIYAGEYQTGAGAKMLCERLLTRDEFLLAAAGHRVITSDRNVAEWARGAGLDVDEIDRPRGDAIALLGWKKIRAGETVLPENLEANYIRRTDAEIFAKPTLNR